MKAIAVRFWQKAVRSRANAVRPYANAVRPYTNAVRPYTNAVRLPALTLHYPCTWCALSMHLDDTDLLFNPLIDDEL